VEDGLYLIKPDYAKYIINTALNCIQFKNQPAIAEAQICSGSSVIASVNPYAYNGYNIQWYKDGHELAGESATDLNITQSGDYTAVVYDPCSNNIHFESNHLKVSVISSPTVNLNYPDKSSYCNGTSTTFMVEANSNYQ